MKSANSVLAGYGTTIFTEMSALAQKHGAINLGQGFPDDAGPRDVREAAAQYLLDGNNQYAPMMGLPALRQAVAAHDHRFYGLDVDWQTEVMVTSGATEALADCLFGLIEPGDEVIVFEPLYDTYVPIIRRAGGVPVYVTLAPPLWELPREALAAAFSPRTKLVLLNSPMNPSSKVFSREELSFLASLCVEHDVYAVCDEVYEHLVYDGAAHIPLMTLPGMRQRSVRIASAGKTFSLTGWKIGYVTAPALLLAPIAKAHQFVTFTSAPSLQHGIALGLQKDAAYFDGLAQSMIRSRDRLAEGLRQAGFRPLPAHGTYFITADYSARGEFSDDVAFCKHLVEHIGVAAIPASAFYDRSPPRGFARFCFCKSDDTIDEAIGRLRAR